MALCADDFGKGITIPVLKDKLGDVSSVDNYRPITISPVICKIFKYCLLFQFEGDLESSHLQFGFKNNSSCSHAIFLLKEVTDYFVSYLMVVMSIWLPWMPEKLSIEFIIMLSFSTY